MVDSVYSRLASKWPYGVSEPVMVPSSDMGVVKPKITIYDTYPTTLASRARTVDIKRMIDFLHVAGEITTAEHLNASQFSASLSGTTTCRSQLPA